MPAVAAAAASWIGTAVLDVTGSMTAAAFTAAAVQTLAFTNGISAALTPWAPVAMGPYAPDEDPQ